MIVVIPQRENAIFRYQSILGQPLREQASGFYWRFALLAGAPVKASCAQRHLLALGETLYY